MATFFHFDEFGIPALETDGRNWQQYRASLELVTNEIGLIDYLVGTVSEGFSRALDTQTRFLLVSALPDPIAIDIIHFQTATEIFDYLRRQYEKTTDDDSARVTAQPVEPIDARMHSHSDSKTDRTVETAVIEGSEWANGADEDENGGMYLGNGATDEKHTSEPTAANGQDECGDADVVHTETHPTETCDIDEGVGRDLEVAEEVGNASKDAAVEGKRIESCRNESIQGERASALKRTRSTTATEKSDQRTPKHDDNIPREPPLPPAPPDSPRKHANPQDDPQSFALEEGRRMPASIEAVGTPLEADASPASGSDDDTRN